MTERPDTNELLLIAALSDDAGRAIDAWNQWEQVHRFEDIGAGIVVLLPYLYNRLQNDKPFSRTGNIQGVVKKALYRTTLNKAEMRTVMGTLDSSDIAATWVRDCAIANTAYKGDMLRPVNHLDILVSARDRTTVLEQLKNLGWVVDSANQAGCKLLKGQFLELNLRWQLNAHWTPEQHGAILLAGKNKERMSGNLYLLLDLLGCRFTKMNFVEPVSAVDFAMLLRIVMEEGFTVDGLLQVAEKFLVSNKCVRALKKLEFYTGSDILEINEQGMFNNKELALDEAYDKYLEEGRPWQKLRYHYLRYRAHADTENASHNGFARYCRDMMNTRKETSQWLAGIK